MPRVPQQDKRWTLLQKAFGSSIPIEQMEKSRLLPGGAPAPFLFLPQAVPRTGRLSAPAKSSAAPSRCGNCFMRLPSAQGPSGRTQGGAGLLVVASVFPANMTFAKVSHPTCAVGLPRSKLTAKLAYPL